MSTDDATIETARAKIADLVERFSENEAAYKNPAYNETQTRREFIDPFFKALGWDVDNERGYAPAYKDVIHEDAIKVGGMTKAPDYCFRIGGQRKFFVEAKKPSVDMKKDPDPYYQLRRYAYSAKLPLSIVTDFQELAIVDCRAKPSPKEKASTGRIRYWHYEEYIDHIDELLETFSPEGIKKGGLDKMATTARSKRGTGKVDKEFLREIEAWRDLLARNIALRNPGLSQRELNETVQATIDRIIFLRICEDRGIEAYGQLQGMQNGANIYARLCELFQKADERYNSGLFHFRQERGNPSHPDELTLSLAIDDKPLKQILKGLYYPDSPYEFSVLPIDILGQVYEQFLGKVIRLTAGHRAIVEDKPEVKKAGGVYYTPTYIVDYIVKNTVGKLLEDSTPTKAAKLRILDPACGSGSFLIGAYEYLLDWHRDWYSENDAEKWAKGKEPRLFEGKNGWQLTTAEKKRILLNNIYGVDIDPQAVEVSKLSLLLKVLEEESQETMNAQLKFFHERALPDLGNNIKCGNSLIGTDFYEGQQMGLLDEEEALRINAFDWDGPGGFPEIMKAGGFDAVIGNPPYVRIQAMKEWAPAEVEFYKQRYISASKGNYDIYQVMVERGLELMNMEGSLGFILPHKFFNSSAGMSLRKILASGKHLSHVVHFGHQQVFEGATTYTCLMFLAKTGVDQCVFESVEDITAWRNLNNTTSSPVPSNRITEAEWNFVIGNAGALFERLITDYRPLGEFAGRIAQGIRTSANEVYVLDLISTGENFVNAFSKILDREVLLEQELVKTFLQGREIKPYSTRPSGKIVIIPYVIQNGRGKLINEKEMGESYKHTYAYFTENRSYLENRERGKMKGDNWYGFVYPKNIDILGIEKILVPDIADKASFAFDASGDYAFTSGYAITLKDSVEESLKYFLGLLNSSVGYFFIKNVSTPFRGGFFRYFSQFIEQMPVRAINFSDLKDKDRHNHIVELVDRMLTLSKRQLVAKTSHEKETIQRQIDSTDREINQIVYILYDLSEDEIEIVESQ
ncbi:MAG: Eco57I restriction-modification methylase domain-containing protein [Thermoleophilia bacterium]